MNGVIIKERSRHDLAPCIDALAVVHHADRYPLTGRDRRSAAITLYENTGWRHNRTTTASYHRRGPSRQTSRCAGATLVSVRVP